MPKNIAGKKSFTPKAEVILLGLEIHAKRQVTVRQLMIDLWRINTGRRTCEDLGLKLAP